jgi:hypothetical protein
MKLNTKGFTAVEGVIIVLVLAALGGVGYYVVGKQDTKSSVTSESTTPLETTIPEDLSGVLPLDKIEELAKKDDATVTIKGIELKTEDGVLVYVVHLSNGKQITFNATSGEQVAVSDDDSKDDDSLPGTITAKVSLSSAVDIAKKEHPGVAIEKIEVETEDGLLVYRVKFVDEALVEVDANNGSIMEVKTKDGKIEKKRAEKRNDDDHDDDGQKNKQDSDDDNDGRKDTEDSDDDNDGVSGSDDKDDDNDDVDDSEDDDKDEQEDENEVEVEDNN